MVIGSSNDLALSRWQVITWTNDDRSLSHICGTRPQWFNLLVNVTYSKYLTYPLYYNLTHPLLATQKSYPLYYLTHWGRLTHICVSKLAIIGSDNGLSPGRRQAIIWTNAGVLLIQTLGINFSEILGEIHSFSFSKMHFKMSFAKWPLFCLLNELRKMYSSDTLPNLHTTLSYSK